MTTVRYRKLTSREDPEAKKIIIDDYREAARSSASDQGGTLGEEYVVAAVTAPRLVDADEAETTLEELERLASSEKVLGSDLVNAGDGLGWQTLETHPLTAEWFAPNGPAPTQITGGQWAMIILATLAACAAAMILIR